MKLLAEPSKHKKPSASVDLRQDLMLNPYFRAGYQRAKDEDAIHVDNVLGRCAELERLLALSRPKPLMVNKPKSRKLL